VVIAPVLSLALPQSHGLYVQAALISAVTGAYLAAAVLTGRRRPTPGPVRAGIVCYAGAAGLGLLVALIRGNEPVLIAGQLLSMVLLVAAAVAGLRGPGDRHGFAAGLLVAMAAGGLLQLGWWAWSLGRGHLVERMSLPGSVSLVGPALVAVLVATVSLSGRLRLPALLAITTSTVLIAGSAIRGLWLVSLPALALHLLLWQGRRWRPWCRLLTTACLAGCSLFVAETIASRLLQVQRPNLVAASPAATFVTAPRGPDGAPRFSFPPGRRVVYSSRPIALDRRSSYLLRAEGRGSGTGEAVLVVHWLDPARQWTMGTVVSIPAGRDRRSVHGIGIPPDDATAAVIRFHCTPGSSGEWLLDRVTFSRLGGRVLGQLLEQRRVWRQRIASLVALTGRGAAAEDPAIAFRWTEASRLLEAIGSGSWHEWLVGRGLGATIHLGVHGFDDRGNRVWYGDTNYLHNFYLFLVYKLGLVGTVLVLLALGLWIAWTLRQALAEQDPRRRGFLAAAATAWLAYCVWSLTSPEILDFRMAPLWGLLLAASVGGRTASDAGGGKADQG
jgi:hypothetical protein